MIPLKVKLIEEPYLSMPRSLAAELGVNDGDTIKVIVEDDALRLTKLDAFLGVEGSRANDLEWDTAMAELAEDWRRTSPYSLLPVDRP
ncbi:MAG: hypothetical protein HY259_10855 [Chloroflexi bacterium]|nr:hypothetical protein [Chloroflexota bacterium]MBI3733938.1 hypothetical protein [Chloroflexota bacterium]